jgi:hypothetical protein
MSNSAIASYSRLRAGLKPKHLYSTQDSGFSSFLDGWSANLTLPDYGRVARLNVAARRRTLRVGCTERWLPNG